ncbi:DNA-binding transcriptional regulator, GntR family [Muriicola jejuensis]|uniref:GntR family transcriptional regulator n=1 Tax=Muriicola jejuensis TaxID=504488 RepID=A0A6P0UM36_9FLAO|nr:GntR family transcriptional regulator [Muriicola jejuensis]NER11316.1 GntR family transcriptional regulator [Muriicola jejuensis]SMP21494.1 DNA-binding transcriptional regulator, GntR family [Muriicola jejuensis]
MIEKINFRDQVRNILLDRMKSGELSAGDAISLARLSRELDVSVTPIREALTQLQQSGIIEAIPNRGFIIPEIHPSDVREVYELVAHLECLALENGQFSPGLLEQLKKQQVVFKDTRTAMDRINADMHFHELLASAYKNTTAQRILEDLKIRIFFYEKGFMDAHGFYEHSSDHHDQIIHCLEQKNIHEACRILKENWLQILQYAPYENTSS